MNEFLTTFSSDHSVLWALMVVAVVLAIALALHGFWRVAFPALGSLWPGKKNANQTGADDVVP